MNKNDSETSKQLFTPERPKKLETRINYGSGTDETKVGSSRLFIRPGCRQGDVSLCSVNAIVG